MAVNKVVLKSGKVLMDTSSVTVAPGNLIKGKTALDAAGELIEGNLELGEVNEVEQAVPVIAVSSGGLITAAAEQEGGYVAAGIVRAEKQMSVQGTKTVTPTTEEQTAVPAGVYTTGDVVVAAMPRTEQATPSISISSAGVITASSTQAAGYVAAGIKSATKQLGTQGEKTITPAVSDQVAVESGKYTTGAVTVKGDANLKAENIADGVSIFGVTGTHKGESGSGSVSVCTLHLKAEYTKIIRLIYTRLDGDGKITCYYDTNISPERSLEVVCGSGCAMEIEKNTFGSITVNGVEVFEIGNGTIYFEITAAAGETAEFYF